MASRAAAFGVPADMFHGFITVTARDLQDLNAEHPRSEEERIAEAAKRRRFR